MNSARNSVQKLNPIPTIRSTTSAGPLDYPGHVPTPDMSVSNSSALVTKSRRLDDLAGADGLRPFADAVLSLQCPLSCCCVDFVGASYNELGLAAVLFSLPVSMLLFWHSHCGGRGLILAEEFLLVQLSFLAGVVLMLNSAGPACSYQILKAASVLNEGTDAEKAQLVACYGGLHFACDLYSWLFVEKELELPCNLVLRIYPVIHAVGCWCGAKRVY
ncbi:hypothetical protein Nepgr_018749 [Nepenthes gracilis]|uniref:Uncharacterized protein n=1 Tax=Nepenthes gracilis TaxID=150966 RepID=A0AAD3SRX7_NEPGR|nr:hypothetical protein Nepgr_018749 [Nepenthes gracilis]